MNGSAESCSNCRFWYKDQAGTFCRRFPPTASFVPGSTFTGPTTFSAWSITLPHQWCGEWKADVAGGGVVQSVPVIRLPQAEEPPPDQPA